MAGEMRGEMAEAIAKVALERAMVGRQSEAVFWEEAPEQSVIKPDLTVGKDKNSPTNLLLVNASDSAKESEKKYWRNVGEIFDAKSRISSLPSVINLVFKSNIKRELIDMTAALCDATHLADRDARHGPDISRWLEGNHADAPSKKAEKEALVRAAINLGSPTYDDPFAVAVASLGACLKSKLDQRRSEVQPLWNLVKAEFESRRALTPRSSRTTLLRRGLARWLVFDDPIREKVLKAHYGIRALPSAEAPDYAERLGMLKVRIGQGDIPPAPTEDVSQNMESTTAADLRAAAAFFKNAVNHDVRKATQGLLNSLLDIPDEMRRAAVQIRAMPAQVKTWHEFVLANWEGVCDPHGCYELLISTSQGTQGDAAEMMAQPRVWLYDHLVAVLRTIADKNNNFGYGTLISRFKTGIGTVGLMSSLNRIVSTLPQKSAKAARRWIEKTLPESAEPGRRGFQDWLAGNKTVSPVIIGAFAYSLATLLSTVPKPTAVASEDFISAHAYSFWNKLLTHQDFEPLPALIQAACGSRVELRRVRTLMADLAERSVQDAGLMPAFVFPGGLICWKSVTDAGKDHKRKELCGRARALRFRKTVDEFGRSPEVKRLYLVIDGTFDDTDLRVLTESGFDRIFYPDEMEQLVDAIKQ